MKNYFHMSSRFCNLTRVNGMVWFGVNVKVWMQCTICILKWSTSKWSLFYFLLSLYDICSYWRRLLLIKYQELLLPWNNFVMRCNRSVFTGLVMLCLLCALISRVCVLRLSYRKNLFYVVILSLLSLFFFLCVCVMLLGKLVVFLSWF